jgi:hypothetical protein
MRTETFFYRIKNLNVRSVCHSQARNYVGMSSAIGFAVRPQFRQCPRESYEFLRLVGVQIDSYREPPNFGKREREYFDCLRDGSQSLGFATRSLYRKKRVENRNMRWKRRGGPRRHIAIAAGLPAVLFRELEW